MIFRFIGGVLLALLLSAGTIPPHYTTDSIPLNLETIASGPQAYPPGINPLTGLPAADPAYLERRPVIAKISNAPPLVRPQAGLGAADLVYEHYAEGGLTRFSAIYYGQGADRVGSIRSARLIDYELLPMYQAMLAFSGASIGVEERLNGSEYVAQLIKGVLYGRPYYWRDEAIPVPHNMFTNVNALWALADAQGSNAAPDLRGMAFDPAAPAEAEPGEQVEIRYRGTRVRWEYDAEAGLYRRFADNQPHHDGATLEQITAANVAVVFAQHEFTDIVESEWQGNVSFSIEIMLWFEGDALLFRDGQMVRGRWVRPTRESMISFQTADGEVYPLKPGNTWFQVVRLPDQMTPAEEWVTVGATE